MESGRLPMSSHVRPLPRLFGSALATRVSTGAVNVRSFLHRLTLRAAILTRRDRTRTNGVRAFLSFRVRHVDLLLC